MPDRDPPAAAPPAPQPQPKAGRSLPIAAAPGDDEFGPEVPTQNFPPLVPYDD